MNLFQNVAVQWVFRRAQELGGIFGFLAFSYAAMPPEGQNAVNDLFTGGWREVTLGAVASLALYLFSQVQSYRATTRSQIVVDQIVIVPETADKPALRNTAARVERKPNLLERMLGRK